MARYPTVPSFFAVALLLFAFQLGVARVSVALEIRTVPSQTLHVYAVNQGRGIYDGVIHSFAVLNETGEVITIDEVRIDALKNGDVIQSWWVSPSSLVETTSTVADFKARDALEQIEVYFHTIKLVGHEASPATSSELSSDSFILGVSRHLVFLEMPEELRLGATGTATSGEVVRAETILTVEHYKLKNEYNLPVAGRVNISSSAEPQTNHRWSMAAEFAIDFDAISWDTSRFKTDRTSGEDFYIFGRDVLASADGTVVEVISDREDPNDFLRAPGEDIEAAVARVNALNREVMREDIRALCGNRVVIDHGQGEFSLSCHLKQDSVRVAVGARVRQGEVIAQVGNSGNAGTAHLHFQISDGPDQFTSRSLPVTFSNVQETWGGNASGKYLMGGQIVEAIE